MIASEVFIFIFAKRLHLTFHACGLVRGMVAHLLNTPVFFGKITLYNIRNLKVEFFLSLCTIRHKHKVKTGKVTCNLLQL